MRAYASVAPPASSRAYARHRSANSASGQTRVASPMRRASPLVIGSPLNTMSIARPQPTSRGRKYADAASGTSPTFDQAARNVADSLTTRTSHETASPKPAPAAIPFTAATTGLRISRIAVTTGW